MDAVVTTKAAVLHALGEGPRYGSELMRILSTRTPGLIGPRPGTIYPALKALVAGRYVRSWKVVPGSRRGGRSRTYYELTPRGMQLFADQRRALQAMVAPARQGHDAPDLMVDRIRRAIDLSELSLRLRDAFLASGHR
jgi:DNA-binding PadR family transcriptional regulator